MPPVAILDTSVLYAPTLRDALLRCAELKLYELRWSPDILTELRRSLTGDAGIPVENVERLLLLMTSQFPDATVDGYQSLIPKMTNHPKDRHVLAAAVQARVDALVTLNLRDFLPSHASPYEIVVQSPDDFLMGLAASSLSTMRAVIGMQAAARRQPPTTVPELLTGLERVVPNFARFMRIAMSEDPP